MTHKVITLEFVVPTLLAIALGVVLSIGAVHLIDNYLVPIDRAEAPPLAATDLLIVRQVRKCVAVGRWALHPLTQ